MMKRLLLFIHITVVLLIAACTDNDSFSMGYGQMLSFSADTISFDTLFSTVPSATTNFWVYNRSSDGIRIKTVRLERGSQSGYRVNVDGTFLDPVGSDFEVRKGDSILVFVEVTTHENSSPVPEQVSDNLLFTLENGTVQKVALNAYSWDALQLTDLVISRDTVIESSMPLVLYGSGIRVDSAATLTLRETQLYFHDGAGIEVCGQLVAENCLFRGDRLDKMFSYLPYDRVSGQWRGISIASSSKYNSLINCEIRNAVDALSCDSTTIMLSGSVIHNSGGFGFWANHSHVTLSDSQFTNSLGDCLSFLGGMVNIDHCTLAQFYPFSANRGVALRVVNAKHPSSFVCTNTLATGYEDKEVVIEHQDTAYAFDYRFVNCLLRVKELPDTTHYHEVLWESPTDSVQGKRHFYTIDEVNLYYDFRLDSISPAFQRKIGRIPVLASSDL